MSPIVTQKRQGKQRGKDGRFSRGLDLVRTGARLCNLSDWPEKLNVENPVFAVVVSWEYRRFARLGLSELGNNALVKRPLIQSQTINCCGKSKKKKVDNCKFVFGGPIGCTNKKTARLSRQ
jgi:hypothetical protein